MRFKAWCRRWWARNIIGDNSMDDERLRWQKRLEREQRDQPHLTKYRAVPDWFEDKPDE